MSEAATSRAFDIFLSELRRILQNLYNPQELRRSPLLTLLGVEDRSNPMSALRQHLIDAIQMLKPQTGIPTHSDTWRAYHILMYRYVEQSDQKTVANNMGLSVRQLRRQERRAEQVLADYLWARYNLLRQAETILNPSALSVEQTSGGQPESGGRDQELEWARNSLPSQVTDIPTMIRATLATVGPLVRALKVDITSEIEQSLPPVTGQGELLQQAFLNLLTAAIQTTPGGQVRISAEQQNGGIVVCLETDNGTTSTADRHGMEHLEMACRCIEMFGGQLVAHGEGDAQCTTALLLPVTEPVPVLVIDDNLDTLQLFQRYLSGTHYQLFSVHAPEEALNVAEAVRPQAVVLDVMLPGIDGWELLGRLREHPATRSLPVIICTVMPQEQLALALGAAAYLRKPVSREMLVSTLDQQVHSRKTESD